MEYDIYPEAVKYLTEERGLTLKTLEVFRVGVDLEKFRNDLGHLSSYDSVYFPLFAPKSKKGKKKQTNAELDSLDMNKARDLKKIE